MFIHLFAAYLSLFQTFDGLVLQPSDGRIQNLSGAVLPKPSHGRARNVSHMSSKECVRGGDCYLLEVQWCETDNDAAKWNIHGLWPQWAFKPCTPPAFVAGQLSVDLTATLKKEMPGCKDLKKKNDALWKHEWDKHGSCACTMQDDGSCTSMTQEEYFQKTVDLYEHWVVGMDRCNGDEDIPITGYGKKELLEKKKSKRTKELPDDYYEEITHCHVCFDKEFNFMPCEGQDDPFEDKDFA